jgi:L-asparaginase
MRKVLIITTGGTIASVSGKGPLNAQTLLENIPQLSDYANVEYEEYCCIGSSKMTPELWLGLAKRVNSILNHSSSPDGIVITHGTDTLEEAGFFLNLTVKSVKPVILTGAMRTADDNWPDGPLNLNNAVRIAVDDASLGHGVLVTLNEDIFAARDLTKSHNQKTDAFTLSHSGWIGCADSRGVLFQYKSTMPHTLSAEFDVSELDVLPKVSILSDYIGFEAGLKKESDDSEGVVIRSFAGGRCSRGMIEKIRQSTNQGTPVVLASRVHGGRITDLPLDLDGLIASNGHTENKSQILLMLGLTKSKDPIELQRIFNTY